MTRPQSVSRVAWAAMLLLSVGMLINGSEAVTGSLLTRPSTICGSGPIRIGLNSVSGSDTLEFFSDRAGVTIDPISFGVGNSGPFDATINCGLAQGTFRMDAVLASNNQRLFGFEAVCKGDLFFAADVVTSTVRGTDFDIVVQISPPAQEEVELTVNIDNPLVIPGGHRITIPIGETEGRMRFISPVGDVGPVNINLHSRKLFDYGPRQQSGGCADSSLNLAFKVLGTMTTSFFQSTIGDGVISSGFVTLAPPAGKGGVLVSIDYSDVGIGSPAVVRIDEGKDEGAFQVLPQSTGSVKNLALSAEYYVSLQEPLEVLGTIFVSIPDTIVANTPFPFTVSILPAAPSGGLTVTVVDADDVQVLTIDFEEGESLKTLTATFPDTGSYRNSFSAPDFVTFELSFDVVDAAACPAGSIPTADGRKCARCPGANSDSICSNNGQCVPSTFDNSLVRCKCDEMEYYYGYYGYYYSGSLGPNCEFSADIPPNFSASGDTVTFFGTKGYDSIDFTIPANILPDPAIPNPNSPGPEGFAYIIPVTGSAANYDGVVNARAVVPNVSHYSLSAFDEGFLALITANDNTVLGFPNKASGPAAFDLFFDPLELSQTELSTGRLFYWNIKSKTWMPAVDTCPTSKKSETRDLNALSYHVNVCSFGQFQFFLYTAEQVNNPVPPPAIIRPDDDQLNAPDAPLTTGFAPPLPAVQPDLNGDDGIGLVPLPVIRNSASALSVQLFALLAALALLF